MTKKEFSYKIRPGYGSDELLIEFDRTGATNIFIPWLLDLLSKNGFKFGKIPDIWVNDEINLQLKSKNGSVTFNRDIYDLIFILGDKNQQDILRIDEILINSGKFHKVKVDFDDYILEKD